MLAFRISMSLLCRTQFYFHATLVRNKILQRHNTLNLRFGNFFPEAQFTDDDKTFDDDDDAETTKSFILINFFLPFFHD